MAERVPPSGIASVGPVRASAVRRRPRPPVVAAVATIAVALAVVLGTVVLGGSGREATRPAETGAAAAVARLSDAQLAGQGVIVGFRDAGAQVPATLRRAIERGRVGGVILFSENGRTVAAIRALTRRLQAIPRPEPLRELPLLVLSDQEGGLVRRVADAPPSASAAGQARQGRAATERAGRGAARALCRAGVSVNLAPVADLATGFIAGQRRSYGRDPRRVATLAGAFVRGARRGGIASTAKHFPGLAGASGNTDEGRAVVDRSRATLRGRDERPFAALIDDGVELVMLSNAIYPALDRAPAVLSRRVTTGELRDRLGFRGVTISDDLQAGAFRATRSRGALAVAAARAGTDLLLYGQDAGEGETAVRALAAAVDSGDLSRERLRAAVGRTLALRERLARTCRP